MFHGLHVRDVVKPRRLIRRAASGPLGPEIRRLSRQHSELQAAQAAAQRVRMHLCVRCGVSVLVCVLVCVLDCVLVCVLCACFVCALCALRARFVRVCVRACASCALWCVVAADES